MKSFLSDLPPRILTQKVGKNWLAWYFDGCNPISDKYEGETKEKALENLKNSNSK